MGSVFPYFVAGVLGAESGSGVTSGSVLVYECISPAFTTSMTSSVEFLFEENVNNLFFLPWSLVLLSAIVELFVVLVFVVVS